MKFLRFFLLLVFFQTNAWSQPVWQRNLETSPSPEQQWRSDLRSALQERHERALILIDANPQAQTDGVPLVHRHHMSAQERAELRQQLHQQYLEAQKKRAKLPLQVELN